MQQIDLITAGYGSMKSARLNRMQSKSSAIFDELESRFSSGCYKFGQTLSPVELADEFGVSLQPLSAALGQLQALGFVAITPQVGCRVISPSATDIKDFFRLFARMEGVVASLAAERHDAGEIKRLEGITRRLARSKTNGSGLPEGYARMVAEWHAELRVMARAPSLEAKLSSAWKMSDFMLFQGATSFSDTKIQQANTQRNAILDAIKARNQASVEELMYEHVAHKPYRAGILDDGI